MRLILLLVMFPLIIIASKDLGTYRGAEELQRRRQHGGTKKSAYYDAIIRYLGDMEDVTIESLFQPSSKGLNNAATDATTNGRRHLVRDYGEPSGSMEMPSSSPVRAGDSPGRVERLRRARSTGDGDPIPSADGPAGLDSWSSHSLQRQHRRRKKGCPPLHGKRQHLCPSQGLRKYDVCISKEAFCDAVNDCPNGEDEDPKLCFFYKQLDRQLKTLSHAVALVVDGVLRDQNREEL